MAEAVTDLEKNTIIGGLKDIGWLNVQSCEFRKSKSGNIIGMRGDEDVFIVFKDGCVEGINGHESAFPEISIYLNKVENISSKAEVTKNKLPRLKAKEVLTKVQGEVSVFASNFFVRYIDRYIVSVKNEYALTVTPFSGSKYISSVKPVTLEIKSGWSMSRVIRQARESAIREEYQVYLSQLLREKLVKTMNELYLKNRFLRVSEELIPYLKKNAFFRWANGLLDVIAPNQGVMDRKGRIRMEFAGQSIEFDITEETFRLIGEDTLLKTAAFTRRNRKKMISCVNQLSKHTPYEMQIHSESIDATMTVEGRSVRLHQKDGEISATQVMTVASKLQKKYQSEDLKVYKNTVRKIRTHTLYGSAVASAVADCVLQNKSQNGVTKHMILQSLRGLKKDTKFQPVPSFYSGRFSLIPDEYIKEVINDMIEASFLEISSSKDGTYRACFIHPAKHLEEMIRYDGGPEGKDFSDFTDYDWIIYLRSHASYVPASSDQDQLPLLEHPAVFCLEPELVAQFLATKDEYWMDYIETMRCVESGIPKKYWKAVQDEVQKTEAREKHLLTILYSGLEFDV